MKKSQSKSKKKELEESIIDKFSDALKSLGHDAATLTREIKKAGKVVVKKISDRLKAMEKESAKKAKKNKKLSASAQVVKAKAKSAVNTVRALPSAEARKTPVKKASVSVKPAGAMKPKASANAATTPVVKTAATKNEPVKVAAKSPANPAGKTPSVKTSTPVAKNTPEKKPVATSVASQKAPAKTASGKAVQKKPSTKD